MVWRVIPKLRLQTRSFDSRRRPTKHSNFPASIRRPITVDTPLPFSLKQLWFDLLDFELRTFVGDNRDDYRSTRLSPGDPDTLAPPEWYQRAGMGSAGPFLNQQAFGIQRPLNLLRSRLLDRRYDFLLRPGPWGTRS